MILPRQHDHIDHIDDRLNMKEKKMTREREIEPERVIDSKLDCEQLCCSTYKIIRLHI